VATRVALSAIDHRFSGLAADLVFSEVVEAVLVIGGTYGTRVLRVDGKAVG
jgi:hypothetical protein